MSEDKDFALRVLRAGYKVVYEPKAVVYHSHNYTLVSLFKRRFKDGMAYSHIASHGKDNFISRGLRYFVGEMKFLVNNGHIKWIPYALIYDFVYFLAFQLGKCEEVIPSRIKKIKKKIIGWGVLSVGKVKVNKVILITIDALRADHLGFMGYEKNVSPNIDKLAMSGIVFTRAYANGPGTPSSFSALFSSTYPLMYGGYERFSKNRPAIQSYLLKNGIKTAGIHSNPYLSRYYGYNRGFEYFYDAFDCDYKLIDKLKEKVIKKIGVYLSKNKFLYKMGRKAYFKIFSNAKPYIDAKGTTKKALSWIKENKDEKFFLWVHYMDPHEPYNPSQEFLDSKISPEDVERLNRILTENGNINDDDLKSLINLYDGEIRCADHWIGKLVENLEGLRIPDDYAIIITADHGEEFLDHGDLGHHPKLYNELIHVPLIIHSPQLESNVVKTPVESLDIAPTIVDIFGLKVPKYFLGRSLLREVKLKPIISEVSNPHGILKIDEKTKKISCIKDEWKVIFNDGEKKLELYNLTKDPKERENLALKETDILEELFKIISTHKEITNLYKAIGRLK